MILSQTIKNLLIGSILIIGIIYPQNCTTLNPFDYGDCQTPLGYVWAGDECVLVSGCDMQNDQDFFL